MKKTVSLILTAAVMLCCLVLAGCSNEKYTSSYTAKGFAHSNTDNAASMSFSEFQGTKVFTLKFEESFSKTLLYNLKLETGNATIYYDADGKKTKLVSLKAGDNVKDKLKDLKCESMYIIVETSDKCTNGNFSFETKVL